MKLGVVADIHGNEVALRAVLADASGRGIDRRWALGDLVLFGPRPAEVLLILRDLPGLSALSGNTDRYVLTGQQPPPHATAADASADAGLVERFGAMAGQIVPFDADAVIKEVHDRRIPSAAFVASLLDGTRQQLTARTL